MGVVSPNGVASVAIDEALGSEVDLAGHISGPVMSVHPGILAKQVRRAFISVPPAAKK